MNETVAHLIQLPYAELDKLFADADVDEIPDGDANGCALIATGTACAGPIARFIKLFVWQGKIFDAGNGLLKNKLTPFGIRAVSGRLYIGPSRHDNRECIVLDYSKTSYVAFWIRDELREIKHPIYLGKVYVGSKPLFHFALEFRHPLQSTKDKSLPRDDQ